MANARQWSGSCGYRQRTGDKGEQGEQHGGGAGDGAIGPLTLGFDAEVTTDLSEGHLDRPAADESSEHVGGTAYNDPAQRDDGSAGMAPHSTAGGELDAPLNETLFFTVGQARSILARCIDNYNTERPHSSLGYATPAAFAAGLEQQRAGLTPPVASPALMRDNTGQSLIAAG